jgi:glucose dehydrogenase
MTSNATRRFSVSIPFHWLLVLLLVGISLASFYLWKGNQPVHYSAADANWVKGRQYVVIACGGGKLRSKSGGYYVAFALKE